jgi:hypothetical protein
MLAAGWSKNRDRAKRTLPLWERKEVQEVLFEQA